MIDCNGRELTIWDLAPLMRFKMRDVPIKHHGKRVVEDEEARAVARELIAQGHERLK